MSYRKKYIEEFLWETSLFRLLAFLSSWVNSQKYENLLQFDTSWLASLKKWHYFRLCFTFSWSGYDLTLIKTSDPLNCYLFLQKFLLEKNVKSLIVTMVAQTTVKTTNSENTIYLLSLMSGSIKKLVARGTHM